MGSTTPLRGYPYPASTDKIAQGAVNMEGISEAVENSRALATNAHLAADLQATYPVGHSQMYVSGSGVSMGWPSNYGNVITIRTTGSNGWQWFYPYSTVNPAYLRYGDASVWFPWHSVGGPGAPTAEATGTIVCAMPNSVDRDVQAYSVTYPSNRFKTTPRVFLNYGTSAPVQVNVSIGSPTATSVIIYYYRANLTGNGDPVTTSTSVYWHAIEGAE